LNRFTNAEPIRPSATFSLRNISTKNVISYIVLTRITNPANGQSMGEQELTLGRNGTTTVLHPLRPGQTDAALRLKLRVTASGSLADHSVIVDLVEFEDGTTWGPARHPSSQNVLMTLKVTTTH
jgi:hypothetical protein